MTPTKTRLQGRAVRPSRAAGDGGVRAGGAGVTPRAQGQQCWVPPSAWVKERCIQSQLRRGEGAASGKRCMGACVCACARACARVCVGARACVSEPLRLSLRSPGDAAEGPLRRPSRQHSTRAPATEQVHQPRLSSDGPGQGRGPCGSCWDSGVTLSGRGPEAL